MRFNDPEHIRAYTEEGKFPKIHDEIFKAIEKHLIRGENVLEVGPCIGMLASRIIDHNLAPQIIAFEPNKNHLKQAIKKPEIRYINSPIEAANIKKLYAVMKANQVKTIVARRSISEVAEYGGGSGTVKAFAKAAFMAGVERVILEGRMIVKNPVVELWNADLEAGCFNPYYKEIDRNDKNVRVLERVKNNAEQA